MARTYMLIIEGQEVEQLLARTAIEAIKLHAMVNSDGHTCTFFADEIVVSTGSRHTTYASVEYYSDDNSLYVNGKQVR